MIQPKDVSIIVAWPRHMDYPLFRYNLKRFRKYFENVYIVMTQDTMGVDYFEFLLNTMQDVTFIKPPMSDGTTDWRNIAVRDVLLHYPATKYVLFLEQDFLIKDERLFEVIYNDLEYNTYFYLEGDRIHPAFALVPREFINKTSMDFGVQTQQYDHFGLFFKQLISFTNHIFLEDIGLHDKEDYHHLAGLTNNYHCFNIGQPLFRPEEFLVYNHYSQKIPLPQSEGFRKLSERIEASMGSGDSDSFIQDFFPKL